MVRPDELDLQNNQQARTKWLYLLGAFLSATLFVFTAFYLVSVFAGSLTVIVLG